MIVSALSTAGVFPGTALSSPHALLNLKRNHSTKSIISKESFPSSISRRRIDGKTIDIGRFFNICWYGSLVAPRVNRTLSGGRKVVFSTNWHFWAFWALQPSLDYYKRPSQAYDGEVTGLKGTRCPGSHYRGACANLNYHPFLSGLAGHPGEHNIHWTVVVEQVARKLNQQVQLTAQDVPRRRGRPHTSGGVTKDRLNLKTRLSRELYQLREILPCASWPERK